MSCVRRATPPRSLRRHEDRYLLPLVYHALRLTPGAGRELLHEQVYPRERVRRLNRVHRELHAEAGLEEDRREREQEGRVRRPLGHGAKRVPLERLVRLRGW